MRYRLIIRGKVYSPEEAVNRGHLLRATGSVMLEPDAIALASTGKTDTDGNEIFDGDVLVYTSFYGTESRYEVIWDTERAGFYLLHQCGANKDIHDLQNADRLRVVGNIHTAVAEAVTA